MTECILNFLTWFIIYRRHAKPSAFWNLTLVKMVLTLLTRPEFRYWCRCLHIFWHKIKVIRKLRAMPETKYNLPNIFFSPEIFLLNKKARIHMGYTQFSNPICTSKNMSKQSPTLLLEMWQIDSTQRNCYHSTQCNVHWLSGSIERLLLHCYILEL